MLERLKREETGEASASQDEGEMVDEQSSGQRSGQRRLAEPEDDDAESRDQSATGSLAFRLGHLVLGGVLAFMALDNVQNLDGRIEYADSKGAPRPDVTVPVVSGLLQAGSVGVALWRLPTLSTAAVAGFFASVTPVMHDFWAQDGEERQEEQLHFLKNTALFGAVLALFGLGRQRD